MNPWGARRGLSATKNVTLCKSTTRATTIHLSTFTLFQSLIARIATGTTYVAVDHSIYQPDNLWQHAKDDEQAS